MPSTDTAGTTPDLARLTTIQLLGILRPSQILAIVAVVVGLATGAFALGRWVSETAAGVERAKAEIELAEANGALTRKTAELEAARAKIGDLQGGQTLAQNKLRFLDLMVVWYQTRDDAAASEERAAELHDEVSRNLFRWVMMSVERSERGEAKTVVRARLGKGENPTLHFEADQTTYRLPPDVFSTAEE